MKKKSSEKSITKSGDISPPFQVNAKTIPRIGIYEYYCQDQFGALDPKGPFLKYNSEGQLIEQRGNIQQINRMVEELKKEGRFPYEKKKKKSYYKPVAGRRKTREGTKRKQTVYEGARSFEYETIAYFEDMSNADHLIIAFRRPVSQSPADVWAISGFGIIKNPLFFETKLVLTQCKTTLDTKPPKKDPEEVKKFIDFGLKLGANICWADRWKKNKNVYIRRIQRWNTSSLQWETVNADFTNRIKKRGPLYDEPTTPHSSTS